MLRAYAAHMTNLNSQANNVAGDGAAGGSSEKDVDTVEDFEKAVADATVKSIKLNAAMALPTGDKGVLVETGRDLSIDLNGESVTATSLASVSAGGNQDGILAVKRGAKLTLDGNGTVDGSGATSGLLVPIKLTVKGEATIGADAEVIVNSGTYKGRQYVICGSGTRQGGKLTVNGGTFDAGTEADDAKEGTTALYQPMSCNTTINDGEFTGTTGVVIKCGTCTINGGTFNGTGDAVEFEHYGNGWYNTGDAFAVEACNYPGGIPTVKINGGTFNSTNGAPIASYAQAGYEDRRLVGFVYGGTFNKKIDDDLIADGYQQIEQLDGTWRVEPATGE